MFMNKGIGDLPMPAWAKSHQRKSKSPIWPTFAAFTVLAVGLLVFTRSIIFDQKFHESDRSDTVASDAQKSSEPFSIKETLSNSSSSNTVSPPGTHLTSQYSICPELPQLNKVLLIFKTGATAAHHRVPPHLDTTLSCLPKSSYVLVSDLDETLVHNNISYQLHDVLASETSNSSAPVHERDLHPLITPTRLVNDPSFELYRALRQTKAEGRNVTKAIDSMASDSSTKEDGEGWKLDKWKFLPMLSYALEAAENKPDIDWFFFVEADTYFSMRNLLLFLYPGDVPRYDPSLPWYVGAPSTFGEYDFAHGGSGFLVSRPALRKAVDAVHREPRKWETETATNCCGDDIVAKVLKENDIWVTGVVPTIQGETPASLDYLGGGEDPDWCKMAATWHHADAQIIDSLWYFELRWWRDFIDEPIRHKDVFYRFIYPELSVEKEAWDNDSQDQLVEYDVEFDEAEAEKESSDIGSIVDSAVEAYKILDAVDNDEPAQVEGHAERPKSKRDEHSALERAATLSFEGCRALCEADSNCMQFSYITGKCGTSGAIRLGKQMHGLVKEGRRSGWMLHRIREKIVELDEHCSSSIAGRLGALEGE